MAAGLFPKYTEDTLLGDLSHQDFIVIAIEAAKKLKWEVYNISRNGFLANTPFSANSWHEVVSVKITDNSATLKSECGGSQLMDWGKNKSNVKRFIETINQLKEAFTKEELASKYEELKPAMVEESTELMAGKSDRFKNVFAIFIPVKGYFITPLLIDLNILIFALMVISGVNFFLPENDSLLQWGANFRPVTLSGEWWRLITNCFLHIGVVHLLMNMYALLYIGVLLEPYLGKTRFLSAYLLTGVAASVTSLWWHELTISAGASGAIFGMYGVFLAMLTTNLIEKAARKALLTSIAVFVVYNLANGLKGGIDNAAHIGGLISGIAIGYSFIPGLKKPDHDNLKYASVGILTVLVIAGSYITLNNIPNDIGKYEDSMKEFTAMENQALKIYRMSNNDPKEQLLAAIKDSGLYNWNKMVRIIGATGSLNLPALIKDRNAELLRYCNLRIKSFTLIYKAIDENTTAYQDSIESYNKSIEAIINDLKAK